MTRFTYVRHGQTAWNAQTRIMGQRDVPLTDLGRRQAEATAEALRGDAFDALYASDLCRAQATAEAINRYHGLKLELEPRLRERAFGALEGLTPAEIRQTYPEHVAAYERDTLRYRAPGAESRFDFLSRVGPLFDQLADRHPDARVLVVAHGGVLRAWLSWIVSREMGLAEPRFAHAFAAGNCSISRLRFADGAWEVASLNATGHLRGVDE